MSSSRRQYPFHLIEPKWQKVWDEQQAFRAFNPGEVLPHGHPFSKRHGLEGKTASAQNLPGKYYILDMFPYPSGAGLHVGHPEGYTATDILARYKRAQGFNVLHPMGWDSFGLPAEQYAVKTGQHPRVTTEANITTFKRQIQALGFSYDWSRELATTDTDYFKWTQWIFLKLYNSWFNPETQKSESIETLLPIVKQIVENAKEKKSQPTKPEPRYELIWNAYELIDEGKDAAEIIRILIDSFRLAYVSEQPVWWCEELGTVLANEEVVDGKSEVGGFPVIRKPMRQWMLRITAYAERLISDLNTIDWTDSLKEMQRNWIGRSEGVEVDFEVANQKSPADLPIKIKVFTTRPDTLFGATYLVLSPEHDLADLQTLGGIIPNDIRPDWKKLSFKSTFEAGSFASAINEYKFVASRKSDLERTNLAKDKSGQFTGAFAINPVSGKRIPIYIADYVLASYGTGAIMAVPAHDERDMAFALKFKLKIHPVVEPSEGWLRSNFKLPKEIIKFKGGIIDLLRDVDAFTSVAKQFKKLLCVSEKTAKLWLCYLAEAEHGKNPAQWTLLEFYQQFPQLYSNGESYVVFSGNGHSFNSGQTKKKNKHDFNGILTQDFKKNITDWLEIQSIGKKTVNFKLRDWLFSRQRYWGEPFPIIWKKDAAGNSYHEALTESSLPVLPPTLEDYKPTATGEPPLARAKDWVNLPDGSVRETNTMPQWAGSCWYYLRYTDAKNSTNFISNEAERYWMGADSCKLDGAQKPSTFNLQPSTSTSGVDLYVGGTEHAVLHLLYARFWHKVLFDLGFVSTAEPFHKLVNQGIILGEMEYYAFRSEKPIGTPDDAWVTAQLVTDIVESGQILVGKDKNTNEVLVGVKVSNDSVEKNGPYFMLKNPSNLQIRVEARCQKMSKSRGNVVNPDDVLSEYGSDAFRLYEMFMGPLEMVKPWNTKGVEGVYRFLGRAWRLFVDEKSETAFEQAETTSASKDELLDLILLDGGIAEIDATPAQLKTLHACIKKVTEDLDGMRFNTAISAMMVFINEAMTWQTKPLPVMKTFLQLLAPFAPHIAEELWARLHATFGQTTTSLAYAPWPKFDLAMLVESEIEIPVSVNGKMRGVIKVAVDADNATIEAAAKASEKVQPFLAGKTIKKIIIVPKKMVNLIVA